MTSRPLALAFCLASTFALTACKEVSPNWTGPETGNAEMMLAKDNCACYEDYFRSIGIKVDLMLSHYDEFAAVRTGTPRAEVEAKYPSLHMEFAKIPEAKKAIAQTPCHRALTARAKESHPDEAKVVEELRGSCRLYLFMELY
jgi:hypothetical protein